MRVYLAIKYHSDNKNRPTVEKISAALAQNGFKTICIARDVEEWGAVHLTPQELMQRSFEEIDSSDVVVIDLTEKGVGLGIEAGYAYAKGVPIFTVAKTGSDISATLQGISQKVIQYDEVDELMHLLVQKGLGDFENEFSYS